MCGVGVRGTLTLLVGLAVMASGVRSETELRSGIPIGDYAVPFDVKDITGPRKGEALCYYCQYGLSPVVCVFTRAVNGPTVELIARLDAEIAGKPDLKGFVVLLTDNESAATARLKRIADEQKLKHIPLTLISDLHGPADYAIAPDAEVTVLMWRAGKVRCNQAFRTGRLSSGDIPAIVAELPRILVP